MGGNSGEDDRINVILASGLHEDAPISDRDSLLQLCRIDSSECPEVFLGSMQRQLEADGQYKTNKPVFHGICPFFMRSGNYASKLSHSR